MQVLKPMLVAALSRLISRSDGQNEYSMDPHPVNEAICVHEADRPMGMVADVRVIALNTETILTGEVRAACSPAESGIREVVIT